VTSLVIVMCLLASPTVCEEHRPYDAVMPMACAVHGQMQAAQFLADHPKWMLSGWRCEPIGREKRDA
jgi:hypothetical protein